MLGFSTSPSFVEHVTGPHHPERPDRIRAIARAVRLAGLVQSPDPFPDFEIDLGIKPVGGPAVVELTPCPAEVESVLLCHTRGHLQRVQHVCALGGGVLDQGDTPVVSASCDAALLSLGALLGCCDAVIGGKVRRAFSAGRPPGHHAEPDRAMGFCLFSNVAIAARSLRHKHGVGRVAIVDFDVHHGNGTQACLEDDPSILFVSLHQHPSTCYPGSGFEWEIGSGPGRGYTINLPFQPGSDDGDYLKVMGERVVPAVDEFRPELLLISAGFDAHQDDPLANMNLSEECFGAMTERLVEVANAHCGGRVVSALEGGYNLRALGRRGRD